MGPQPPADVAAQAEEEAEAEVANDVDAGAQIGEPEVAATAVDTGGPIVGAREESLIAAIGEHIASLNALDRAAFVGRFLDDCADPEAAGGFSYSFASPTVEAAGSVSDEFESITFLADNRARVAYVADVLSDIWVVREGEWRISTCPE